MTKETIYFGPAEDGASGERERPQFSVPTKDELIAISQRALNTMQSKAMSRDEFKDLLYTVINDSMLYNARPLGLTELSRKYAKAAKKFDGLPALIKELVEEARIVTLVTHKRATILLTADDYIFACEMSHESGDDPKKHLFNMYHDRDKRQY